MPFIKLGPNVVFVFFTEALPVVVPVVGVVTMLISFQLVLETL
jgi:hypothetical protein